MKKVEKKRVRCLSCGFYVRGKNHEQGQHHKNGKDGKCRVSRG